MRDDRDGIRNPPTEAEAEEPVTPVEPERAGTGDGVPAEEAGEADQAVSPDQPTFPPPPPEGTETTEPVEEEDLPQESGDR